MSHTREIFIEPAPERVHHMVHSSALHADEMVLGRPVKEWQQLTREEMLPGWTDRTGAHAESPLIISTGHQAEFWHAGILAKYFAMDSLARHSREAVAVELVVDQDVNDPFAVRFPVQTATKRPRSDRGYRLDVETIHLNHPQQACADRCDETWAVALASRPPLPLSNGVEPGAACAMLPSAPAGVVQGIEAMRHAMAKAASNSTSLAEQVACANAQLRGRAFEWKQSAHGIRTAVDAASETARFLVMATRLSQTSLFRALVEEVRNQPRHLFETYNAAVARYPHAHVSPLDVKGACENRTDGFEIPLWRIDPDTCRRHRACVGDLHDPDAILWPRALMMTALVRLGLVDLFIHGRGGSAYEQITERWMADWLDVTLAPMVMVSATMLMNFGLRPTMPDDLSQARWFAHHLQYNVDRHVESEDEATRRKRELLDLIERAPRRSTERLAAYLELQRVNTSLRHRHGDALERARQEVAEREDALAESHVLLDRTWAFPFHDEACRRELASRIDASIHRAFTSTDSDGASASTIDDPCSDGTVTLPPAQSAVSCDCRSSQ